jgi:hypothetical protein
MERWWNATEHTKYTRTRQTHLVYLLFIVELATCFAPGGSSSGLYVNLVMLNTYRPDDDPAGSKHVANSTINSK